MSRNFIYALMLSTVVTACGERPPIDWMYAEYKSLTSLCQGGRRVSEKSSTASLIYTWSCPHPKNLEVWLSEFETKHLNPRGWQKGKLPPPPYAWITYCISDRNVLMRIVQIDSKNHHEDDRLEISLLFPGDKFFPRNECQVVEAKKVAI